VAGQADARLAEKLDIAKNLLDLLDDEMIAKKTGLSLAEITKLRQNQK